MAKRLKYYPYSVYVKDRPAQRQRCPECGYDHYGRETICQICRDKVTVTRCEPHDRRVA